MSNPTYLNTIIEENTILELTEMTQTFIDHSSKKKNLNGNAIFIQEKPSYSGKYKEKDRRVHNKARKRKIVTWFGSVLIIALFIMIAIPFGLQLRASSLLQARLAFVRRILNEVPLLQGNGGNISGLAAAYIWPVTIPCGAQYLDAVQLVLEELDSVHRANKSNSIILNADNLRVAEQAIFLQVRGGHAFGDSLAILRTLYNLGVRIIAPMYKCQTVWASSVLVPSLSEFGELMIREMNRLGIVIDLTGSDADTALDILRTSNTPVVYSEASVKAICNDSRFGVTDELIRSLAANGGVILVSLHQCQHENYPENVIAHINHIRSIAGIAHVGISGGDDPELMLAQLVRDRQWGVSAIKQLVSGNLLRVLIEIEIGSRPQSMPIEDWIEMEELDGNTYCRYPGI